MQEAMAAAFPQAVEWPQYGHGAALPGQQQWASAGGLTIEQMQLVSEAFDSPSLVAPGFAEQQGQPGAYYEAPPQQTTMQQQQHHQPVYEQYAGLPASLDVGYGQQPAPDFLAPSSFTAQHTLPPEMMAGAHDAYSSTILPPQQFVATHAMPPSDGGAYSTGATEAVPVRAKHSTLRGVSSAHQHPYYPKRERVRSASGKMQVARPQLTHSRSSPSLSSLDTSVRATRPAAIASPWSAEPTLRRGDIHGSNEELSASLSTYNLAASAYSHPTSSTLHTQHHQLPHLSSVGYGGDAGDFSQGLGMELDHTALAAATRSPVPTEAPAQGPMHGYHSAGVQQQQPEHELPFGPPSGAVTGTFPFAQHHETPYPSPRSSIAGVPSLEYGIATAPVFDARNPRHDGGVTHATRHSYSGPSSAVAEPFQYATQYQHDSGFERGSASMPDVHGFAMSNTDIIDARRRSSASSQASTIPDSMFGSSSVASSVGYPLDSPTNCMPSCSSMETFADQQQAGTFLPPQAQNQAYSPHGSPSPSQSTLSSPVATQATFTWPHEPSLRRLSLENLHRSSAAAATAGMVAVATGASTPTILEEHAAPSYFPALVPSGNAVSDADKTPTAHPAPTSRTLTPTPATPDTIMGDSMAKLTLGPTPLQSGQVIIALETQGQQTLIAPDVVASTDPSVINAERIRQYLNRTDRLMYGERAVLIMNTKIAQRSYGSEKRLICPPPACMLLGANWWSQTETPATRRSKDYDEVEIQRPEVSIHIGNSEDARVDSSPVDITWLLRNGNIEETEVLEYLQVPIGGLHVSKGLYMPESLVSGDKSKKVETVVTIHAPGPGPPEQRLIGSFPSRPMTIISKPSKKRPNTKNAALCIHHGSTVCFFSRSRSQSGLTKYLSVSGYSSLFPSIYWKALSGAETKPYTPFAQDTTSFVARTNSWNAFLIYIVDLSLPSLDPTIDPDPAQYPGIPRPPINAIPVDPNSPTALYYNMPIVLQCVSTAVVSPVMIIRKIDSTNVATGGGDLDGFYDHTAATLPCAPGERLGEPVSQLQKVALEIFSDIGPRKVPPQYPRQTLPEQASFLAVLGEAVGVHRPKVPRRPLKVDASGATPRSNPTASASNPSLPLQASGDAEMSDQEERGEHWRTRPMQSAGATPASAAVTPSTTLEWPHPRKRGSSMSAAQGQSERRKVPGIGSLPNIWTVECGDPAVWTIVGVDVTRHSFFVPSDVAGVKMNHLAYDDQTPVIYAAPVPPQPISRGTPYLRRLHLPGDHTPTPPEAMSSRRRGVMESMITIQGENLDEPDLQVWFDDEPCTAYALRTTDTIVCQPPVLTNKKSCRVLLLRPDGVIYPSSLVYPPPR